MAGSRAAIRYAKAVLELATSSNSAEAVNTDMTLIAKTISDSKDLSAMLHSPVVRSAIKKSALLEIFNFITPLTVNLFDTLIENKRLSVLEDVAIKYMQLFEQASGKEIAIVTTVVPLTSDLETKVLAKLKSLTGKAVDIKNVIDESIIGGFVLRVGDMQYDASVANKLNKIKQEFSLN
ncbi:ATP synthase F1 subunit delta [Formosa algae]|uniref:ATP synthase subunit delta n=1 Tax=Formosa algae TaxID=225843 RepID=A0A9X0YHT9_9FLAO|nr:ATP synthase F1 subunit delta [Formosa algae]MBP1838571.1 F-type H+-transporting ATPase subunit delta [Formosa algae]MDQ0335071.1 F-type H+-transporting ATPase subunit delta [Formosa algae]OEI79591.1 ATP synthase F1 subunit delta [Formosa algae]